MCCFFHLLLVFVVSVNIKSTTIFHPIALVLHYTFIAVFSLIQIFFCWISQWIHLNIWKGKKTFSNRSIVERALDSAKRPIITHDNDFSKWAKILGYFKINNSPITFSRLASGRNMWNSYKKYYICMHFALLRLLGTL